MACFEAGGLAMGEILNSSLAALPLGHLSVFLAHSWLSLDWVIPGEDREKVWAFYHLITYCHLYNFLLIHWVQPTLRGRIKCYFLKGEGHRRLVWGGRQKDAETFNNNEPTEANTGRGSQTWGIQARCTVDLQPRPRGNKASSAGAVEAARFCTAGGAGRAWLCVYP